MVDMYNTSFGTQFFILITTIFGNSKNIFKTIKLNSNLTNKSFILDIGGGYGRIAEFFLKETNKVVVLDPSEKMLDLVKNHKIIKKLGTAEKIPFKNKTFDLIYCVGSFHHFTNNTTKNQFKEVYNKCALEMLRVLKNEGVIIIVEPNPKNLIGKFIAFWERNLGCSFFAPEALSKLFKSFNCKVQLGRLGFDYFIVVERN